MAAPSESGSKPTVCILYGVCEGSRLGRAFGRSLQAAGFALTSRAHRADIIIAHSGGCFVLPQSYQAKTVVLIGLPCAPGKANAQKAWLDLRTQLHNRTLRRWLVKTCWNFIYFWNMPYNWRMWQGWRANSHQVIKGAIVIRNRDDLICKPDLRHFTFRHPPTLISLPGQHDDCWQNPGTYVDIVRKYYHGT